MSLNSLDNVVFENRNKLYGAYYIRARYVKNVLIGLGITLFFTFCICFYLISDNLLGEDETTYSKEFLDAVVFNNDEMLLEEIDLKPYKEEPISIAKTENAKVVAKVTTLNHNNSSKIETTFDSTTNAIEKTEETNTGSAQDTMVTIDLLPAYNGGVNAFRKYIEKNIPYPDTSYIRLMKGPLEISFIVSQKGTIEFVGLNQFGDTPWGQSVINVVKSSPKWQPAYRKGKAVKMLCRIPIYFVH